MYFLFIIAIFQPAILVYQRVLFLKPCKQKHLKNQWSFLVPLIGGRYHIIPQLAIYKWYISGIYCQLGDYMVPTIKKREPRNSIEQKGMFFCSRLSGLHLRAAVSRDPCGHNWNKKIATVLYLATLKFTHAKSATCLGILSLGESCHFFR